MDSLLHTRSAPATGHLAIHLLGRFAVMVDAVEIPQARWPSLRATHLVQLLSLQPRHRMTRDQLIDALWPSLGPQAGGANLRKAVHHARQALGRHDAISLQAGEVALWPGRPVAVDTEVFEQAAAQVLRHGDPAACAALADTWTGELLPGTRYESWTETARERLLACHLALLRASGQWQRLTQHDPTDEPACRALMRSELEAGNRAAALRCYGLLREALQQVLGVSPDAQTEALYAQCLAGLQSAGPSFIGRAVERAQATAWLDLAAQRRPGGLVLLGPAGIGKSALGREVSAHAQQHGWQVLRVDASEAGKAYATVAALADKLILRDRAVLDDIGAPARSVLAQISDLAAPAEPLLGPLGRHQVVGALRRLLLAASGDANLLVQVDDAHLLDDADVDVLLQLAIAGAPLGLLLSMRALPQTAMLARGIARLHRAEVMQVIELAALPDEDARRLIQAAATVPLPDAMLARLIALSEGNAFAAVELARCAPADASMHLPRNAAEAIAERLCDVPDEALSLVRWLALSGDVFDVHTIDALGAQAGVSTLPALDAALRAGVLVPAAHRYRFRHELVRQALAEPVPQHVRVKMHRRIAAQLADMGAPPAGIARHWDAGGQPRQALPWWLEAARDAVRLAAFSDALRHLEPVLAQQPDHAEALRLRAEALDAMGDPGSLAAYRLAAQAATGDASHDLRAKAALAQVKLGDPKGALLALEGVRPTSVEGKLCQALAYSGAAALGAADPAMGTAKAAAARRLALESGDATALVIASWAQAAAAHARGELHRSVWADLQETSQVPRLALRVFDGHLCITQRFLYGARPYAEVIAFAQALTAEAQRLGARRGEAFGTTLQGEAQWLAGDLPAARRQLRAGARLHRAIGGAVGEALSLQRLAEVALHECQLDEARDLIDEALDLARQTDVGFHLLDRIYGTRIQLHHKNPAAALHAMEDAGESVRGPLETCPGCRITFAMPAAIAAARAGALELADHHETQCAYLANVVMRLPAWYAAHDEVRGHIAQARHGRSDEATGLFRQAQARFRDAGQPLDAARCARLADAD